MTIEPANVEDDINENVLQKAREVTLAYKALNKEKQKTKMLLNYIVHDLKNPLMVLQSAIILLQKEELSELGEEIIESSNKALDNQDQLINDVLDVFSSDFYAKDPLIYERQFAPDVLTCAEDVIDKIFSAFKLNQVSIVLDPNLDKDVERIVVGEKAKLCRIVCNLTENALRHSPKGSSVLITIEDDGDHFKLAVKDEGPGIPDDILSDIFNRVPKGKRKSGSTGLGLFFCRSMIEHWGGQIGYTPRPEGGSEFWIRLPKLMPDG